MRTYTAAVRFETRSTGAPLLSPTSPRTRRRPPASAAEQKRRRAWGKTTGGEYHLLKINGRWGG